MFELSQSPYLGYILFSIGFTLKAIAIVTLQAKRDFKRVQRELAE